MSFAPIRLAIILVVFGTFFVIGMRVIITRRPVVMESNTYRWISALLLCILFSHRMLEAHSQRVLVYYSIGLVIIAAVSWYQRNDVNIFGIAQPALRESLAAVFKTLNLDYAEDEQGISIPAENVKIAIFSSSGGTTRLCIKDRTHYARLQTIAGELKKYYASQPVNITRTSSITMCVICVLAVMCFYKD